MRGIPHCIFQHLFFWNEHHPTDSDDNSLFFLAASSSSILSIFGGWSLFFELKDAFLFRFFKNEENRSACKDQSSRIGKMQQPVQ